jgi:hypothetical protein
MSMLGGLDFYYSSIYNIDSIKRDMENTNYINKYFLALISVLVAIVFLIASPLFAFAQHDDYGYDYPDYGYDYPDYGYDYPDYGYDYPDYGYDYPDYGYDYPDYGYDYPDYGYDDDYYTIEYPSTYYVIGGGFSGGSYYSTPPYVSNYNSTVTTGGFSGGTVINVPPTTYVMDGSVVSGGFSGSTILNTGSLSGTCSAGVSNTQVGGTVTWYANITGGDGIYSYYWTGDEGLSASGQTIAKVYTFPGIKNATVTITSNGQSISRTCSVNVGGVQNQVLAYTDTNPLSSVYLSDVPYTGAGDSIKIFGFILGLVLWSMLIGYMFLKRKESEEMIFATNTLPEALYNDNEKESSVREFISKNIVSDKYDVDMVEEYARTNKVLLSSDASAQLVKFARLNRKNISGIIQSIATGEWVAIGEKDLEKYI